MDNRTPPNNHPPDPDPDLAEDPEYTEIGFKIHKLRLTFKIQKRSSSRSSTEGGSSGRLSGSGPHTDPGSPPDLASTWLNSPSGSSSVDNRPRSRRPLCQDPNSRPAKWEFRSFFGTTSSSAAPGSLTCQTPTPSTSWSWCSSAGYASTSSVMSSGSTAPSSFRASRLPSSDDSAFYSQSVLLEDDDECADDAFLAPEPSRTRADGQSASSPPLPPKTSPPRLPPRGFHNQPPSLPPYPSSLARAIQEILRPLER